MLFQFFPDFFRLGGVIPDAHKLKDKELYKGHKNCLHIVLKCTNKRGGIVESRGSVMDSKCDKRRGLTIKESERESIIHIGIEH